jgi:hypothetical protein
LARSFDGAVEPALVVRGKASVFPGKNTALIGYELPEKIGVLKIQRVSGEINFRLGPRGPHFND